MGNTEWEKLPNIDKECFGCGPDNPHGLKMTFETNGEKLRSTVRIPSHLRGWNNIAHGGVMSTIADEIMAWSAIHLLKRFILTKEMTTRFLKPVLIGTELEAVGYVKDRIDQRNAIMACRIFNTKNELCAKAEGKFALFNAEQFASFKVIPDHLLDQMAQLFAN